MANKKKNRRIEKALQAQEAESFELPDLDQFNENNIEQFLDQLPPDLLQMLVEELSDDPELSFEPEDEIEPDLSYYEDRERGYYTYEEDDEYEPNSDDDPFVVSIEVPEEDTYISYEYVGYPYEFPVDDPLLADLHQEIINSVSYTVNGETKLISDAKIQEYVYTNDLENYHKINFLDNLVINDEGLPLLPLSQQTPEFVEQHRDQPGFHIIPVKKIHDLMLQISNVRKRASCEKYGKKFEPLISEEDILIRFFKRRFEMKRDKQVRAYELKKYGTNDPEEIYHIRLKRREERLAKQAK